MMRERRGWTKIKPEEENPLGSGRRQSQGAPQHATALLNL